jgi:general secretion pathway protein A
MTSPPTPDPLLAFAAAASATVVAHRSEAPMLPSRAAMRDEMAHAISSREGLIVLTGPAGVGKTMLVEAAVRALSTTIHQSTTIDPPLTFQHLVGKVLLDFGAVAPTPTDRDPLAAMAPHERVLVLNRFLEAMPSPDRAIVVVDDAHLVAPAVLAQLRTLTNLQNAEGKLLQMILVGEASIDRQLESTEARQLKERIARRFRLDRLTKEEIVEYARQRIARDARWSAGEPVDQLDAAASHDDDPPPMDPTTVSALATLSRGIPATLNRLCDGIVETTSDGESHQLDRAIVIKAARNVDLPIPFPMRVDRGRALAFAIAAIAIVGTLIFGFDRLGVGGRRPLTQAPKRPTSSAPQPGTAAPPSLRDAPPVPAAPASGRPELPRDRLPSADAFLVAVASFRSAQRANETAKELTDLELPAFVRDDGAWQAVLVGPYLTEDEAREARDKIDPARFGDLRIKKSPSTNPPQ